MIERKRLENELKVLLFEYNKRSDIDEYMIEELSKRNFGDAYKLMQGGVGIELVDDMELGVFTYLLHQKTGEERIDPEKFFMPPELREIKMYKRDVDRSKGVIFENVIEVAENVWVTSISVQEMWELHNKKVITYNKEAQRSTKLLHYGNRIIEKIDLDRQEVSEISEKMISGTYKVDMLSFNVNLDDEDAEIAYDPINHTLTVYGMIEVNDGFHRYSGMLETYRVNPNSDFKEILKITNYSLTDAKDAIAQFDKQRKLKIEHAKTLEADDLGMVVAQEINKSPRSEFRGKIVKDKILIDKGIGVTYFSTVATAVNVIFEDHLKTQVHARKVSKFLIEALNTVYAEFYDEFESGDKKDLKTRSNTMALYVVLAGKLFEKGDKWDEDKEVEMQMMLEEIDFDPKGELDSIKLANITISNRAIIKMKKWVENKFN